MHYDAKITLWLPQPLSTIQIPLPHKDNRMVRPMKTLSKMLLSTIITGAILLGSTGCASETYEVTPEEKNLSALVENSDDRIMHSEAIHSPGFVSSLIVKVKYEKDTAVTSDDLNKIIQATLGKETRSDVLYVIAYSGEDESRRIIDLYQAAIQLGWDTKKTDDGIIITMKDFEGHRGL